MKITKIALMLIVGMFVSVQAFAYEAPSVDKITSAHSIYLAPKITDELDLDFRMCSSDSDYLAKETDESAGSARALTTCDGGKVEVGWQISLISYENQ